MVIANLMNLCEIEPHQVYDWFMQTHVDSADWVMGPNVYGMGLFSEGGVFATKPYLCGSNYLLKMSDYREGEWSTQWTISTGASSSDIAITSPVIRACR
jgi:deoxyribodipyrimidine photolyase-related protein